MIRKIIAILLIVLCFVISIFMVSFLPEKFPIHWGFDGPDNFVNKYVGVFLLPVLMLALFIGFTYFSSKGTENNKKIFLNSLLIILTIIFSLQIFTFLWLKEYNVNFEILSALATGVLIALLGNIISQVDSNSAFGVRTPWTLKNEDVWKLTNRLVARIMVIGGIILTIIAIIFPKWASVFTLILIFIIVLISIIASYYFYKKTT